MDSGSQKNSDLSSQYQSILDQYAKELQSLNPAKSDIGNPPLEVNVPPPVPATEVPPPEPISTPQPPIPSPPPVVPSKPVTPPAQTETSLPPPPTVPLVLSSAPPPSSSGFFKVLFYLSLLVFLGVFGFIIYTLFIIKPPSANTPGTTTPSAEPTIDNSGKFCEVNDQNFKIGETFPAADGCNTCSCTDDQTVSCTEISCDTVPASTGQSLDSLFINIGKLFKTELMVSIIEYNFTEDSKTVAKTVDLVKIATNKAKIDSVRKVITDFGLTRDSKNGGEAGPQWTERYQSIKYLCDLSSDSAGKISLTCADK